MHDHFRRALEDLDGPLARKIWHHVMPHLPVPVSEIDTIVSLHMARTSTKSIRFRLRAYSHAWLVERGYPSCLPDELRPRAERIYPVVVGAVGLAVYNRTPVALAIRAAMEAAVYDEGVYSPRLKRAILSARDKAKRQLL